MGTCCTFYVNNRYLKKTLDPAIQVTMFHIKVIMFHIHILCLFYMVSSNSNNGMH